MKIKIINSCRTTNLIDGVKWESVTEDELIDASVLIAQRILEHAANGNYLKDYEFRNLLEMLPPTYEEYSEEQCETCGETTWIREWEI